MANCYSPWANCLIQKFCSLIFLFFQSLMTMGQIQCLLKFWAFLLILKSPMTSFSRWKQHPLQSRWSSAFKAGTCLQIQGFWNLQCQNLSQSPGILLGSCDQRSVSMVFSAPADQFLPVLVLVPPSQSKPKIISDCNQSKPEKTHFSGGEVGFLFKLKQYFDTWTNGF